MLSIAIEKIPEGIEGLISRGQEIVVKWTGNSDVTGSPVTATQLNTNLTALQVANTAVKSKTGTVQERDAAALVVEQNIKSMLSYVQIVANANPTRATQIIVNAGFYVKETGGRGSQTFTAESKEAGQITIKTPATREKYPIIIESSPDGNTWTQIKVSRLSACTINGITPGELLYIRYCVVGEDNNNGPYSEAVSCRIRQ